MPRPDGTGPDTDTEKGHRDTKKPLVLVQRIRDFILYSPAVHSLATQHALEFEDLLGVRYRIGLGKSSRHTGTVLGLVYDFIAF